MLVLGDLADRISTRFDVLFRDAYNTTQAVETARLSPLIMRLPLGDNQGDTVTLDWLGAAPQLRQWVDEKRAIGLNAQHITAKVVNYEATVEIDLNSFKDAKYNIYEPRIQEIASNAARLDYNLVSDLIAGGAAATCYDGQYFFDTDHAEGSSGTQSNKLTGAGADTLAHITTDYYKAYAALCGFKDDKGVAMQPGSFRPLVWIPNAAAVVQIFEQLQASLLINSGETNVLGNRFDLVVDPRLSDATDWFMFRVDGFMKPFVMVDREPPHYEDDFGGLSGSGIANPEVFNRRIGKAGAVARKVGAYGMWQRGVQIVNA